METALNQFATDKVRVEAHRDNLDVEKDALRAQIDELQNDLIEAAEQVQESLKAENLWEQKFKALQAEMQKTQSTCASELAKAKADTAKLQQQMASIQDTTQLGKMQKQLSQVQMDAEANNDLIAELQLYLTQAVAERDALAEELKEYETQIDQRVADRIADERNRVKKLDAMIERMKQEKAANEEYYKKMDEEKRALVKQVDDLTHWKSVYEAGHALQQLSRAEKKQADDNKRLSRALEEQGIELGKVMSTNEVLALAFERLKKEAGKTADFSYPDLELHREVETTTSTLRGQVKDLERQVDMVEEENTKLRKALRNQSGSCSEDGFKFPGMDADMLLLVNDFAANIREGKTELPMTDRSRELLEENRKLKADMKTLNMQLINYERSFGSSAGGGADGMVLNDAFGSDMKTLIEENAEVHKKMHDLQLHIDALLKGQSNGVIRASDLNAILSANNELVLKELEELRKSQQNLVVHPLSSRTESGLPPSGRLRNHSIMPRGPDSAVSKNNEGRLVLDVTPAKPHSDSQPSHTAPHTAYWTPRTSKGGMPFAAATPGPATPHGKQLLSNTLYNMNLPPEDWAVDVRELNTQLIECLEQLYEREEELTSQKDLLEKYEQNLGEIKTQMIVLYHDYAEQNKKWQTKEKQLLEEHKTLLTERDGLKLKVTRFEEMTKSLQDRDESTMEQRIAELTRKVTIYESNEAILSRKYISLSEQCDTEVKRRVQLEWDFAEMEATLKQRILFLEQYKLAAGGRLAFVQGKLDNCVPQEDYIALQTEMEALREDHLLTLRREVEARGRRI
ncbi:hypothetical protein EON65_05375 [archaeon]|nr:MAG: hypothetical protein EON65_05375 [archaeon]